MARNDFPLTDSQHNLVCQALVLAADKYVNFAADAIGMSGGDRLKMQFLRQTQEVHYIAILLEESTVGFHINVRPEVAREASAEASRITNQQFADTIGERLKVPEVKS